MATQILDNYYVWPHQRPIYPGEEWQFEKNEMFYNSNSWFPLNHNEVGDPGIFKYYTVDNVGYIPFSYNPYLRQLNVSYDYNIDVIYNNGGTIPEATMDEYMANLMRGLIWNFDELDPNIDNYAPVYYLIITPDEYYEQTLIFAKWLEGQYPYNIWVKKKSEAGETYNQIYLFIRNFYENHHNTDYVLLIGNPNMIPQYPCYSPVDYSVINSDFAYSILEGNDIYPEVAVGRITFFSSNELQFQFNKIMSYYLTEMPPPNPDWRENVLLVAHKLDPNIYNFTSMAEYIEYPYYKWYNEQYGKNPNFKECYGDYGATNFDVIRYINEGVSSVIYFGHGDIFSWSEWSDNIWWTEYEIYILNNSQKLTVVFAECCLNSALSYREDLRCLSESWLIADVEDNIFKGAVATQGFSKYSYAPPKKNYFACKLYECIYDINGSPKGIGWLINASIVYNLHIWNNKYSKHNAYSNIILGDPALRMRIKSYDKNNDKLNNYENIKSDKIDIFDIKLSNPVYDNINLFIKSYKECNIKIKIFDLTGRLININNNFFINKGDNNIDINNINLSSGIYLINISSECVDKTLKFLVIK